MNPSLPILVFSVIAASVVALPVVAGGYGMDLPRLSFPRPVVATVSSADRPSPKKLSVTVSTSGN
ncbi:hypothetical protein [Phaeovulum sp. W22_SRMD_FR3]|uniref:hypothetical protein n=1 Tax=Phaeovulum sp. W22_SRMD_FR3 TaxID=3240274 RepID=UPI003F994527